MISFLLFGLASMEVEVSQSKWATDLDTAEKMALGNLALVAKARKWSGDLLSWGQGIISTYADAEDGIIFDDVAEFWELVATHFEDVVEDESIALRTGKVVPLPDGFRQLAAAFRSAHQTAIGAETAADLGSAWTIATGTAEASAEDVKEIVEDGSTAIRETAKAAWGMRGTLGVLGLGVLGLALFRRVSR